MSIILYNYTCPRVNQLNYFNKALHSSISLSRENAALAGLVEGNFFALIFVIGNINFVYILCDNAPLQKTLSTLLLLIIKDKSFGTTSFTELSLEPVIVQDCIESHKARLWDNISFFFSSIFSGTSSPYSAAITRQNRFCGCP